MKGILFADYVRMIRACKDVAWERHLLPSDLEVVHTKIDPSAWFPMEIFERLGNAILHEVAHGELEAVRMWGKYSVDQIHAAMPTIVAPGDPVETLNRFRVLRSTYFDFDALDLPMLLSHRVHVVVGYHMGNPAEEAASMQTLGFFERLLEVAGAMAVDSRFVERVWAGDRRTLFEISWTTGR